MLDYINELRESVIGAYSSIVQGLKGNGTTPAPDLQLLEPHILHICQFLGKVADDQNKSESVTSVCCGLVG